MLQDAVAALGEAVSRQCLECGEWFLRFRQALLHRYLDGYGWLTGDGVETAMTSRDDLEAVVDGRQ